MKIKRILIPLIIIASVSIYCFYSKMMQQKTTEYITSGRGAINTNSVSADKDLSMLSPVELAAWNGDYRAVKQLVIEGAAVPQNLKIRITHRGTETVYKTLPQKDSGNKKKKKSSVTHYRDSKETQTELQVTETITEYSIVHYTAMEADSEFAEILLKKGFDFTVLNNEGYAPVHIVCQRFKYSERAFPYLKLIADYKIDLNLRSGDSAKRSAFDIAKLNRDYKLVEYLENLVNSR